MWNEENIVDMLLENDRAVERAMVRLVECVGTDMGFAGKDVSTGEYYCNWLSLGRRLSGHHLTNARLLAIKYRRQLVLISGLGKQSE